MDNNYIIQITLVALIVLGAIIWAIVRMTRKSNVKEGGCCGCELLDTCNKKELKQRGESVKHESHSCCEHPSLNHDEPTARN